MALKKSILGIPFYTASLPVPRTTPLLVQQQLYIGDEANLTVFLINTLLPWPDHIYLQWHNLLVVG